MFRVLVVIIIYFSPSIQLMASAGDSLVIIRKDNTPLMQVLPGVTGVVAMSFLFDKPVHNLANSNKTYILDRLSNITDNFGEKTIMVPALLLTYSAGRFVFKDEKLQATSLQSIQAVIVTAIATEGLKHITGRARPFTGEGPWSFHPFPGNRDYYKSMPSGHVSLAFAIFTPYAENYSRWLYLIPAGVAFGRIYQDRHWLSDVAVGGSIGFVSGYLFTHDKRVVIIPNGIRVLF